MGKSDFGTNKPKAKMASAKTKAAMKSTGGAKAKNKDGKNAEQVIMEALATFFVRGNDAPDRSKVCFRTLQLKTTALLHCIPSSL